jgi:transposase
MMSYSVDLRERVVGYVREGGRPTEAARLFRISRVTLYRWLGASDLHPKPAKERRRKLDKVALAAHVRDFPDALLRERAGGPFRCRDQLYLGCAEKAQDH